MDDDCVNIRGPVAICLLSVLEAWMIDYWENECDIYVFPENEEDSTEYLTNTHPGFLDEPKELTENEMD